MTNKEIFEKAVKKAIQNGYSINENVHTLAYNCYTQTYEEIPTLISSNDIIFSYGFAKAFWGEEWIEWYGLLTPNLAFDPYSGNKQYANYTLPAWEYHLQQMVLEDDPISYLKKFL